MGYNAEEECPDCGTTLEETAFGRMLCPECNAEDFKIDECLFLDDILDDLERDPP